MASLNYEEEKAQFLDFYALKHKLLEDAKDSFVALTNALLIHVGSIAIAKIDGRVKEKAECIKKFNLKYRTNLESNSTAYSIREYITDLIGLRVVCLYEDDINKIEKCLSEHFEIIDKTDKTAQIENTEDHFGYKGLHLDLRLNEQRMNLPEYTKYSEFRFEIQVRTIIQDSWSVLDHKIKYKKSIPTRLKRRINTLAALFELADQEFRNIRDSTFEEIKKEEISDDILSQETNDSQSQQEGKKSLVSKLNAFSFLKIANHFFNDFEFEPHKVDGFTQEVVGMKPNISRGEFNFYMKENISKIKSYQRYFEQANPNDTLNPYTIIRHCLFLGNKQVFENILTNEAKQRFESWQNS
ncbi:ppGpp synthetase/RelA/SpoT-type nucleotidyltransferase [Orbus hercynius]|uniref:PpGpp synthetase/RelA/SpoT-type nucleotidyltransferase n=1 Tax=Orbus hercynius TaxID=593135 RepID=A0A495RCT1_9GAMM|nr:(p)ppGpp synthetase [Orbus hercynius]RKS85283.1 ppGpp synthetase/RelA/SpoT-type nucleotidyltransferase [Orbus hercynius]